MSDHSEAIIKALFSGSAGEVYNIGSGEEVSNTDMARMILDILGKSQDSYIYVSDRLGHDNRYAIDSTKAKNELGFSSKYKLKEGLLETVLWYKENQSWWEA